MMRLRYRIAVYALLVVMTLGIQFGCTPQQYYRSSPLDVDVRTRDHAKVVVEFIGSYGYYEGDGMNMYGVVRRRVAECCDTIRGRVVAEIWEAGTLRPVDRVESSVTPWNIPRSRVKASKFKLEFPYVIPADGFVVSVYFVEGTKDGIR